MRLSLRQIARRPVCSEQSVNQQPRAATTISVDENATGVPERQGHGLRNASALKACITAAEEEALEPAVAGNKHQVGAQKRPVILVRLGVQQMDPGHITLSTARCHQSSAAANSQELTAEAPFLHSAQQIVEADAVTADYD